jgi:hypothetical protein
MISEAKKEFSNPEIVEFECEGYPVKIEVNSRADKVFYGGNSLGLLERRNGWLINEGIVYYNKSKKFFTVKMC